MKVEDVRPPKKVELPKDKLRFTLIFKREFDTDYLQDEDTGKCPSTTEEAVAHLQKMAKDHYSSIEDMLMEWEALDGGKPFDNGFELDVEVVVPGQKRLV